jgi:hypothetical protein
MDEVSAASSGGVHSPVRRALLCAMFAAVVMQRPASAQQRNDPASQKPTDTKIRISFNNQSMTATLYDNPSARNLASMLPLDLSIDNYANNEKIAYLPRKLTVEGSGPFGNEAPGDLCYYATWGNLALFYAGYEYSDGLIRLGGIDGSFRPLLTRGRFALRVERLP